MENEADNTNKEPIVSLDNVVISHDDTPLLSNVGLRLEEGEFVYLIGKSGAGKTSLLRTLYADQPIESGTAKVCGIDVSRLRRRQVPELRRRIGIVFQNARLLADRDVNANLEFVLRATGWRKRADIKAQIERTLQAVGIAHKATAMPQHLSEGEQQRGDAARGVAREQAVSNGAFQNPDRKARLLGFGPGNSQRREGVGRRDAALRP